MIVGIDEQADVDVYFTPDEILQLSKCTTLEGVLVKIRAPKRQGIISVQLNERRANERGSGIGVSDKGYWGVQDGFRVELFIGSYFYEQLIQRGKVGTRFRMRDGSEVCLRDISRIDSMAKSAAEHLEYYRDNKEKLPALFGEIRPD